MYSPSPGLGRGAPARPARATAAYMPVIMSTIGTPTFCGPPPGRVVPLAGHAHQAAHGLDHEVVGGAGRAAVRLAEAGDRAVDEARVDRCAAMPQSRP